MPKYYCHLTPKAETRESIIEGKGTFAIAKINKGELIAAFGGKILNEAEWQKLPEGLGEIYLTIDHDLFIGPSSLETVGDGDYINHSCQPNAGIDGQIFLVAMQDIQPNEEICFDYAMVVSDKYFLMECRCGKKECRKTLSGNDWKLPNLQAKYKGYFSSYLQKTIK